MSVTQSEARDIRVERILPYLGNTSGISLDQLLLAIDKGLKESSPDGLTPGLINWSSKNLFTDNWMPISGTGSLTYNEYEPSKIGKGRFQITGTGTWEYDKFLPLSDTRGATGKIYVGSTHSSSVTVGVRCYDENRSYIGTNGGFLVNNFNPPVPNQYSFFKSSVFGEMESGLRFLKPNTRFVKLYIEVSSNVGTVFFDESELTAFELDERYLQVFSSELDWNLAEFFYLEKSISTNFTFRNDLDGRVKTFIIKNTGLSNINITFPTAKWQGGLPLALIRPDKTSVFTFIKAADVLFASVIEELE
jgi:hypothetical protein